MIHKIAGKPGVLELAKLIETKKPPSWLKILKLPRVTQPVHCTTGRQAAHKMLRLMQVQLQPNNFGVLGGVGKDDLRWVVGAQPVRVWERGREGRATGAPVQASVPQFYILKGYSRGDIVNGIIITLYGDRWVLVKYVIV